MGERRGKQRTKIAQVAVGSTEQLSRSKGCARCHGQDFGGGPRPSWIGIAGSGAEIADMVAFIETLGDG